MTLYMTQQHFKRYTMKWRLIVSSNISFWFGMCIWKMEQLYANILKWYLVNFSPGVMTQQLTWKGTRFKWIQKTAHCSSQLSDYWCDCVDQLAKQMKIHVYAKMKMSCYSNGSAAKKLPNIDHSDPNLLSYLCSLEVISCHLPYNKETSPPNHAKLLIPGLSPKISNISDM